MFLNGRRSPPKPSSAWPHLPLMAPPAAPLAGAKMHLLGGRTGQLLEAEAMPGSTQLSLATVLAEQCHPPLLLKSTPCAKWASGCPSPL